MSKNIIVINVDIRETRVALIENGIIAEFHIERASEQRCLGNVVLGRVTRVLPGMQIDALRQMIGERLDRLSRQLDMPIDFQPLFPGLPAFETAADAELVRLLERLTGHASEAVAFGTEAPFLTELGLETVVFGPGEIDCAHKPDEFLALDAIRPCVDLLTDLIGQLCLAPATTR